MVRTVQQRTSEIYSSSKLKIMRIFFRLTVISCCFILSCLQANSQDQTKARDKYTLLTMAYNQRPLLLYKGQLQLNASYKFAARTKSFDSDGNMISLKDNGSASMIHTWIYELKYGITDFIELGIDSYWLKNGIRSESASILSGSNIITTNRLDEYKGSGDLTISAALRFPSEYKFFDFMVKGGLTLPIAEFKPRQPSHTITDYSSPENFTVNYMFNNRNGTGVAYANLSAAGKITFTRISLEARGFYRFPAGESESIRWSWTRYGSTFTYYNTPCSLLPDRSLTVNGSVHYQAAGWLDLFLGTYYYKTSDGWTEFSGLKYANPEIMLITLEPGFELQIAPSLTIYQYAGFQLAGRNSDAPFYLLTTLSFNMFPFWK